MMKLCSCVLLLLFVAGAAVASAPQVTIIPDGVEPALPEDGRVPCDILLRYDDGTDDMPGSGYTLGGPSAPYQYLGIIATPPANTNYLVQSASFWSEFWVTPGIVNFTVIEIANPANTTSVGIYVSGGGVWEVVFDDPITVGPGSDFAVMLCPGAGVWGVSGEDVSNPAGRSYFSYSDQGGCYPADELSGVNLMIWTCVTPADPTPAEESSWGRIKSLY